MAVPVGSIRAGKCYLVEPGSRIRRVLAITPSGRVEYVERSGTDQGGSSRHRVVIGEGRFAQDVTREVPCQPG